MATEPSPLIPLLLVITLGLLIRGGSDTEQAAPDFVLGIPLLLVLPLVYFFSESIIVPLAIFLVTYTVIKILLGHLVLVFLIYFISAFAPSFEPRYIGRRTYQERAMEEYKGVSILLLVVSLFLYSLLNQRDGYNKLGIVFVAIVLYFFYGLSQYSSS